MLKSLYITSTEANSGKSIVSLGVMEMLMRKIDKVGFFRPIINVDPGLKKPDNVINLISSHFNLGIQYKKMYGFTTTEATNLISHGRKDDILEGIVEKFKQLQESCDFILCEGTDFVSSTAAFELDINAQISQNLGAPVLLVANSYRKNMDDTVRSIELALESLDAKGCHTITTIINRTDPKEGDAIIKLLKKKGIRQEQLFYTIPNEESLDKPTVAEIANILEAEILYGKEQLNRHVYNFTVAAMQIQNFLSRLEYGTLIITPGDRADVIIACLATAMSTSGENISGILLTGGMKPEKTIQNLIKGFSRMVPIISVKDDTYDTATIVEKIHSRISPDDDRKITRALAVFEENVKVEQLGEKFVTTQTTIVTPKMFEYELLQRAKRHKQHIVLPEGDEERILYATEILIRRNVVDITLLGNVDVIHERSSQLGIRLNGVNIIDPKKSNVFEEYARTYYDLRKQKGITMENAVDSMSDVNFFGTMMIYMGQADGMVSGAVHTTAATISPAFQIIKTKPGFSIVSSVFFMCMQSKVLVYGDCAINPNPSASPLAEIALNSAQTAKTFGIEPVVAMLSYSTGESGKGEGVERVREAVKIAKEKAKKDYPGLKLDGPIQYDAAVDPEVAKTKMPDSEVAGKATVFIFPDLNTGNNTYKAVQRSAGAVAIGPVLQGLKAPVNDLSRGCTIPDIVNTVAITAIQAQSEKGCV